MGFYSDHWRLDRNQLKGRHMPASDAMLTQALQPINVLRVGRPQHFSDLDFDGIAVHAALSLDDALNALGREEFDAVLFGPDLLDVWPTVAYERVADIAGCTPVVVHTECVEPMAALKRRHDRTEDIIVGGAVEPWVVKRIILAVVLRTRALAEAPAGQIR